MVKHLRCPGVGVLFGIITLIISQIAHALPWVVEEWYSRGLFGWIRRFWDFILSHSAIPGFYIFWCGVVLYWWWIWLKSPVKPALWRARFLYWLERLLGFTGFIVGSFFWLWGFNYARVPVHEQLQFAPEPLDSLQLWSALEQETKMLDQLRFQLAGADTLPLNDRSLWPPQAEDTIRAAVQDWLARHGYPSSSRVRGRMIYPEGLLFSFGASGIYWPWAGEGNLESGMHPLRVLPAMAHEMGHAYGFGDEGVCNFIAYVSLADHSNAYLAYCARLDYWGDLARACRRQNPETFRNDFLPQIPAGILADEAAIRKQHAKYQELAPELRYQVYDSYLKAQGIASGMLNYNEVLMLVEAWKKAGR